jgi:hypothetical protein
LIRRLVDEDLLRLDDRAVGPTGRALQGVIGAGVTAGILHVRGAGRMLHVTRER